MSHPRHSVAVSYLVSVVLELNMVMKENSFIMFSHCLKFHQIKHDLIASTPQQFANRISSQSWASGASRAVNLLWL